MENKKKRKLNWLNIVGVVLILIGLGIVGYDVGTKYFERADQENELTAFMESPQLSEDVDLPAEGLDANVWGSITIDKLGVNHLVAKTSNWDYLSRYAVAYENSPNPPEFGNFSIAAHNGNCASCVFRDFDKLENGDKVELNDKENVYVYEIYNIFPVHYTDVSVLNPTEGEQTLTLITCTEQTTYDEYRTIVKARLIETIPVV